MSKKLIEMIKIEGEVISDAYYKEDIVKAGKKLVYDGPLNRGELPLWFEPKDKDWKEKHSEKKEAFKKGPVAPSASVV